MKQDINGVRTAQDLERKYDLSSITTLKKAVEQIETGLTKINSELESFVNVTTSSIDNLQEQIDGNITTFYYSGIPTLSNLPASEWEKNKYNVHIGDLYYDKNTGYAYRFYMDSDTNIYGWMKITDNDVVEALAIANSASDTADSKRRVFTENPIPPYDNGDLWINNQEIYICQISKEVGETYSSNDFIEATKYTDDTLAKQVEEDLTIVSGRVTTIEKSTSEISATLEESRYYIDSEGNKVLLSDQINKMMADANGVDITLKSVGGNNIFRNTGLWFEESSSEQKYEYWTGSVKRKTNDNSINNTSMLLQAGSLVQEQTVPNGEYCISFKYKKINPLATASVLINDNEYNLDSLEVKQFCTGEKNSNGGYIVSPIVVSTKKIKVEFESDINDAVEVYDLMCNVGPNKFIYSQNQNETTTDTVNISKGITITSTNTNAILKANADGIRILTLNKEIVAYFTDKGLSTNELIVKNKAQICGILTQEVGNQTWMTKL